MYNGWAIALAWPQTHCRQAGAWYDGFTDWLGISKNGYYKVGHAALVLIENKNPEPFYFDFGRYHAPFGKGRVRDKTTDHELTLRTTMNTDSYGNLQNLHELVSELQQKEACHGNGRMQVAITSVWFESSYQKAKMLQALGCIPYGPFERRGTNCSRFVNTIIKAGRPPLRVRVRLTLPPMLTPTPLWNIRALGTAPFVSHVGKTFGSALDINAEASYTFLPDSSYIDE